MMTRFSKPGADVAWEGDRLLREDAANRERERGVSALLGRGPERDGCLLCGTALQGRTIPHRGLPYRHCAHCGHFQSAHLPGPEHVRALAGSIPFSSIYKPLAPDAYRSRVERIYRPKLDWILAAAADAGIPRDDLLSRGWLEIGCGAGGFLRALQDAGATRARGVDREPALVDSANLALAAGPDGPPARASSAPLPDLLRGADAEVFAAFFVLEHDDRLRETLAAFAGKPAGTLFCFAVPTLGLGAALESGFDHHYARNLDSAVHTHLFTDRSIAYALERAGCEPLAQWVFGQDAGDFARFLLTRIGGAYPPELLEPIRRGLSDLQDEWQSALDRRFLSDSRHILAVKR